MISDVNAGTAPHDSDRAAGSEEEWKTILATGLGYALSFTRDRSEAEDLLQDAVASVLSAGKDFNLGYLYTTIRNRFIDRFRRSRTLSFLSLSNGNVGASLAVQEAVERDVFAIRSVRHAFSQLRKEERDVVFLAVVKGYTATEICALIKKPRGTVLSLLHRARQHMKRSLQVGAAGLTRSACEA